MIEQGPPATAYTKRSSVGRATSSRFLELEAKVFMGPEAARTVAISSCYPREGVTYVSSALQQFLSDDAGLTVSSVTASQFLESLPESEIRSASAGTRESAGVGQRSWHGAEGITLIDCPALFSSASAIRLFPYVDGVLLVIKDGERSKIDIQRAVSMVEAAGGRLLGAVLNKRRYVIPSWLYSLISG